MPDSPPPAEPVSLPTPTSPKADHEELPQPVPDVDALIAELKASLASSQTLLSTQATRLSQLADLETELSQLKDQYAFLAAAKEAVEKQLQEETKRREIAEENVDLLRGQVEQARRGVGILQKQEQERKRMSLLPSGSTAGLGLATEPEEVLVEKDARANKRASMLVGRGHRRASSHSDQGDGLHANLASGSTTSPNLNPPRTGGLRELRLGSGNGPISTSAPLSSPTHGTFFEEPNPLPAPTMTQRASSSSIPTATINLGSEHSSPSHAEEKKLRAELAAVRAKLIEAEESREASEACLKALREFMAGGGTEGGAAEAELLKTMRLPPLPTDKDADEDAPEPMAKKGSGGGWPFKLWKQGPTSPSLSTAVEPPATPGEGPSPPRSTRDSLTPRHSPLPTPGALPTENVVAAVPVSSTPLGSFVSGWTKTVVPGTPSAEGKPAAPSRTISSFFSRKKDGSAKDKDLPVPPQESDEIKIDAEAEKKEDAEEGLAPSPQIADKTIDLTTDDAEQSSTQVADRPSDDSASPNDAVTDNTEVEVKKDVEGESKEEVASDEKDVQDAQSKI